MSTQIQRLSESVINKIAAGEVVENGASVLKELIENSLDALAQTIVIRIEGSGRDLLSIEDDGIGMGPEDALMCLQRHATSKISSEEDLQTLSTMGFRGEALAAIAAVSQLELITSNGEIGTCIRASGGQIEGVRPHPRNRGTSLWIRSLFFNVPARQKFQKSLRSDVLAVHKVVETMALARPDVSFSLENQGRVVFDFPAQTLEERVQTLLGPFSHRVEERGVLGFLSAPDQASSHRKGQWLFINKRAVFSPLISKAVQSGYGTRLSANKYPPFVLFLEIDPARVDVNVHPQKKEVRLLEESSWFRKIEAAVNRSFHVPVFEEAITFNPPAYFSLAEHPFPTPLPDVTQTFFPLESEAKPVACFDRFLLLEKQGWILVDLASLRARVLFEEMGRDSLWTQQLMWPIEIEDDDVETVDRLVELGIESRWIGSKKIAIDAIPSSMDAEGFVDFFSAWKEGKRVDVALSRYCRKSRKRFSLEEGWALWQRGQKCLDNVYDPLGKKIWVRLQGGDLEKWMDQCGSKN